ncbi:MAG: hypothetical protein A3F33_03600 [Candidatus Woykebacteria bacterium RIFCSPHIGHO2_12_FULL_43_10]|uniref:Uncharacterized protein n=2 Tax=Candidatus Woykeibacteriota TaxID=1817899 RepID=A0A1G1WWN0_9BACT|nr:MAG: hypothetical protein A3J50_03310 [Candidatus Woykebacteria bacterium RIFCSPHIGHO2_02_FULL_43_16b]OGY30219.1 MAG: hypothetical protein A3F33_03600 [Candidatus Woykebacteria bacterium RIFCSPHIGHO2_12_FULL_43_10]OGY31760.1 MAG: hypothetical protein A3A61_02040 [Candidatus Woykebacteria bacterium RIFCSPLOWO2_01_FULL_43_14]
MSLTIAVLVTLLLYVTPGLILSRFVSGKYRGSFFLWLLLSFIAVPFVYFLLVFIGQVTLVSFILVQVGLLVLSLTKLNKHQINLDEVLKSSVVQRNRALKMLGFLLLVGFFLSLVLPRLGLWQDYLPVGDDKPRVGQVISIATSENFPMHFRLPTTEMSIYFYNMVNPGLLTRFSENFIRANQSWFIHLGFTYLLFAWFIYKIVTYFARTDLERVVMIFGLTLFGGLEYYLAMYRGISLGHLEWWTDWFFPNLPIHMQISLPYTASFWVTQHVFPTFLIFLIYMILNSTQISKKISVVFVGVLIATILGNSAFVFITFSLAYVLFYLMRLLLGKESFGALLRRNIIISSVALLLSIGVLYIFFISGKEGYFLLQTTSFFFFQNQGLGKILNLVLTIPFYLFAEIGAMFLVYLYYLYLFFKKRLYQENVLFLFLLTIPLGLIFVFRAKGDNNFSMRSTLAALVVGSIFSGWLIGDVYQRLKTQFSRGLFGGLLIVVALLSLPSTLWEIKSRFGDQYNYTDHSFTMVDKEVPLNSIVFVDLPGGLAQERIDQSKNLYEYLNDFSHRPTFKPVKYFNISDTEYTSQSAKNKYEKYSFGDLPQVQEFILTEPRLSYYHLYYLSSQTLPAHKIGVGSYWLYLLN